MSVNKRIFKGEKKFIFCNWWAYGTRREEKKEKAKNFGDFDQSFYKWQ